jgi:hypothetical protein
MMPAHDWTRVEAGNFHDFHQCWAVSICKALNSGGLPLEFHARLERAGETEQPAALAAGRGSGVALEEASPKARLQRQGAPDIYASRANRIAIRHRHGEVMAIIEIVSPVRARAVGDHLR